MTEKLTNCRLCSSEDIKILKPISSPYIDETFLLYHCNTCNSKFFNPDEHSVSLDKLYEDFASEKYQEMLSAPFKKNKMWNHQKNIITKLLGKNPKSVLDIGCRTGDFLMHFDKDTKKEGVELSKQYAEVCKKRELTVYSDFVENIDFKDKYDVVTCYALLEHIVDPVPLINQLKELVTPDGLLVILVPWHECLKEKLLFNLGIKWHMFTPPEHLNYYSKKVLNDIITKESDFKLVKSYSSSGGLINPFKSIPVLGKAFSLFMFLIDSSFMNQIPIYDHLYLYYKKG